MIFSGAPDGNTSTAPYEFLPLFQTIEASLSTPEKMSSGLAEMMKKSGANPESLEKPLRDLLKKNGVTAEGLEKAVLVQKAALACGLSSRETSFF